jgi:hypothetical protein
LAAIDGSGPSLLDRPDVAPLAAATRANLSTAYLLLGTSVQYTPDVANVVQADEPLEDAATRVAEEQAAAQTIVALSVGSAAAERGAAVVAERLDTEGVPATSRSSVAGRPWAELFPDRTVTAVPDAGVVLATLTPAPGIRAAPQPFLAFGRELTFILW